MARAHGKVILLGEHAVVYGMPAIAAGIDQGARAEARRARPARLRIGALSAGPTEPSELGRAFSALLAALDATDIEVDVTLDLPPGCGLGASAAIGVAVARAVIDKVAAPTTRARARAELVLAAATEWERVFHGNPSGIDTAAAAAGGCINYRKGVGPSAVRLAAPLPLAIAVAGPPASTRAMVEKVARQRERDPRGVGELLEAIADLVRRAQAPLTTGNLLELGQLLDENHRCLCELQVSSPALDRACAEAREAGALGAKLTGAGGGGAVIALTRGDAEPVLQAWRKAGLTGFAARVVAHHPPGNESGGT